MLRVDQVHVIRHKVLVEGQSMRQVAQQMGVSRNTVKKYIKEQTVPERRAGEPRRCPVLERVQPRIEGLLEEWKDRQVPKQRVTARLLHEQLVNEGFEVGYTTVRSYMAERKRQRQEVFIPLEYLPGDMAQVDFFEVTVDVNGQRRKAYKFVMRLMYSGRDFAWLYERQDQVAFLDAHVRAFEHFGAVPQRVVYDNLSAAVRKMMFPERKLTARFSALACHYVFEPCFARPGEGHDKGGVEARGKAIRLQHLTPIPDGQSLVHIANALLHALDMKAHGKVRREGQTVQALFEQELSRMLPLPEPFDPRRLELLTVSRSAKVQVAGSTYSVPCHWKSLEITARVGCEEVTLRCGQEQEVYPRGAFGQAQIRYRHYLPELAKKPQALRQVVHRLLPELDAVYGELWRLLVDAHGPKKAARLLAGVLGAAVERGEQAVTDAVRRALSQDRIELILQLPEQPVPVVAVPASLSGHEVEAGRAADYDILLKEPQS